MKIIDYLSNTIVLFFLLVTILYGIIERKNIFELFIKGVIEGERIVIKLFPTLLALMVSVGMLNNSGFLEFLSQKISPLFTLFKIDKNIVPLILVRPISASTTTAMATELMNRYGVDSKIGLLASCIMGSTETTIYVASIYSAKINIKDIKEVIIIGLIADFIGVIMSCLAFNLGLMKI